MTFSKTSLEADRGNPFKDYFNLLLDIFKGSYEEIVNAIQPVVTKVKPTEEGFSLEALQGTLYGVLDEMLTEKMIHQYQLT